MWPGSVLRCVSRIPWKNKTLFIKKKLSSEKAQNKLRLSVAAGGSCTFGQSFSLEIFSVLVLSGSLVLVNAAAHTTILCKNNFFSVYLLLPILSPGPVCLGRWSCHLQTWDQQLPSLRPCPSSGRSWPPTTPQWFLWMPVRLTLLR